MNLFIEAFRHQLLPFLDEMTLHAMAAFGGYNMLQACLIAVLGAWLAVFVLFRLGRIAGKLWQTKQPERYAKLSRRLQAYLLALMLLVSSPPGFAIAFAAGLLGAPARYALPLALLGLVLAYAARFA